MLWTFKSTALRGNPVVTSSRDERTCVLVLLRARRSRSLTFDVPATGFRTRHK